MTTPQHNTGPIPPATECEWPVSIDERGIVFCHSKQIKSGSSYCAEHHSEAYYSPSNQDDIDLAEVDTNTVEIDPLRE